MKEIKLVDGWLIDEDNNKCSIAHFGSEEAARCFAVAGELQ